MDAIQRALESMGHSDEFAFLARAILDAPTAGEAARVLDIEVDLLSRRRNRLPASPGARGRREHAVRLLIADMMGRDVSFGHFAAVELVASSLPLDRALGYICAAHWLAPGDPLRLALVSHVARDAASDVAGVAAMGLHAAGALVTADVVEALLPVARGRVRDGDARVAARALVLLHRCTRLSPDGAGEFVREARGALRRPLRGDGAVALAMTAAHLMADVALAVTRAAAADRDAAALGGGDRAGGADAEPEGVECHRAVAAAVQGIVPELVAVVSAVVSRSLPHESDFQGVPAPWLLMRAARLLGVVCGAGAGMEVAGAEACGALAEAARVADSGGDVGRAVTYEVVRALARLVGAPADAVGLAADATARFFRLGTPTMRAVGVACVEAHVALHPGAVAEHQMDLLDCFETGDDTLRVRVMEVMLRVMAPGNADVVRGFVLRYVGGTVDPDARRGFLLRLLDAAADAAPDWDWYCSCVVDAFSAGGEALGDADARRVLPHFVRRGAPGVADADADADAAARAFVRRLGAPGTLPSALLRLGCCVLAAHPLAASAAGAGGALSAAACRAGVPRAAAADALSALLAAVAAAGGDALPAAAARALAHLRATTRCTVVAQLCAEVARVAASPAALGLPSRGDAGGAGGGDVLELSFLDAFVAAQLAAGARAYSAVAASAARGLLGDGGVGDDAGSGLRFEAYPSPVTHTPTDDPSAAEGGGGVHDRVGGGGDGGVEPLRLPGRVQPVWGPAGFTAPAALARPAVWGPAASIRSGGGGSRSGSWGGLHSSPPPPSPPASHALGPWGALQHTPPPPPPPRPHVTAQAERHGGHVGAWLHSAAASVSSLVHGRGDGEDYAAIIPAGASAAAEEDSLAPYGVDGGAHGVAAAAAGAVARAAHAIMARGDGDA